MKFQQSFTIDGSLEEVWTFFAQPAQVAQCLPGVERVDQIDADNLLVRVTQKIGPLGATFESKVAITERVPGQRIAFTSFGKAVRGAIGSFRASNSVTLSAEADRTCVAVDGEVVLGGALGSVAQKIVLKQAEKALAEFAANLEHVLSGEPLPATMRAGASPADAAGAGGAGAAVGVAGSRSATPSLAELRAAIERAERWAKAAAAVSAVSTMIGLWVLWRLAGH